MEYLEEKVLPNIESYGKEKYPLNYYCNNPFEVFGFNGNDIHFNHSI